MKKIIFIDSHFALRSPSLKSHRSVSRLTLARRNTRMIRSLLKGVGFMDIQFIGCRFPIGYFPVIYRMPGLVRFFDAVSRPFCWLGLISPSWFSGTFLQTVK